MRDWLSHRVDASPDATALVDVEDGTEWRYEELDAAVELTSRRLAAAGVEPGDHLGVLLPSRLAFVRLVHAAARLGAVLVPLNVELARPALTDQADRADLSLLVCGAETEGAALAAVDEVSVATVDEPERAAAEALDAEAAVRPATWSLDDPQAMLFTSGTTGDPKAVVLTAGNLYASATASAFRLGVLPDDRWLDPLPPYHMGGLAPLLRSTLYGTTALLQTGFDADATAAALAEYGATGVSLVPTMLRRLLDADESLADSLRFVLLGGAPASRELIERCERAGVPVRPTYGTTETASQVATPRPGGAFDDPDSVGRPLAFTDVTVVDESGDPLPAGETGELVVDGPTVTPGYYGDPEATAEAIGERGLHTGDVGYLDESGRVHVLNRRTDRIVTGGENVHPGEVVEALREHSDVRDAAVVGLDDPEWGERVAALVASEPGAALSVADLRAHCDGRLARYKHPKTVAFADALPRTASGTVRRDAVRERLRDERSDE